MSHPDLAAISRKAGANRTLDVLGPRIAFLTALSDADDEYCLIASSFPAGVVVPVHSHVDRETFWVLEGEIQGLWDERWITLTAGGVLDIPGHIKHAWRNPSDAAVSLLIVTTNRLGRFLRDVGRPVATVGADVPTPAEIQRLFDTARAYWTGSPADKAAVGISLPGAP